MRLTRRVLLQTTGLGVLSTLGGALDAQQHFFDPEEPTADEVIAEFAGGQVIEDRDVTLVLQSFVEDGYRVPVEIHAPGAREIMLVAPANPSKKVLSVRFGRHSAVSHVVTRMRLAADQEVVALARMDNGAVVRATQKVSVLVGGCG
ncbi:MAG: thiosulfate oxidation carrier protein SoxY [Pseudomonadota bacterium]